MWSQVNMKITFFVRTQVNIEAIEFISGLFVKFLLKSWLTTYNCLYRFTDKCPINVVYPRVSMGHL